MTLTPEEVAGSTLPSGGGLDRNIAMELCRVTEAAALAAARWMGRGNKNALDQAAVNAMRDRLKVIQMDGIVVIGEGEKDEAPMLYIGERIGNGQEPKVDVAVDPVDGTTLLSKGLPNAVAVVAHDSELSDGRHQHDPARRGKAPAPGGIRTQLDPAARLAPGQPVRELGRRRHLQR